MRVLTFFVGVVFCAGRTGVVAPVDRAVVFVVGGGSGGGLVGFDIV